MLGHPFGHVVSQVEGLANGQGVEHVAKACVDMIPISYGAYDISPRNFLSFFKLGLKLIEFHTIRFLADFISRASSPSIRGSNKEMLTEYILANKRSVIRMDAVNDRVKNCR